MMQDVEEPHSVEKMIWIGRFLSGRDIELDNEIHFLRTLFSDIDTFRREIEGIDLGAQASQANGVLAKSAARNQQTFAGEICLYRQPVGVPISVPPPTIGLLHDRKRNRLANFFDP